MSITALLIASGVAAAAGGIAKGASQVAASKGMFTSEEERELERLRKKRRQGNLGASRREKGAIEAKLTAQQGGIQRVSQDQALQRQAAGGAMSGRDIFLADVASKSAVNEAGAAAGAELQALNEARRAEQLDRISQLAGQKASQKATKRAGIIDMVTGGLAGAGSIAMDQAQYRQALKVDQAKLGLATDAELLNAVGGEDEAPSPYANRI